MRRSQDRRAQQQYEAQQYEASQQPAPVADQSSLSDQIQQLGALHAQGILSDTEFADAKAKLLRG
jgi:hypothetical protein